MLMWEFTYSITSNQFKGNFVNKAYDEWQRFMEGKPISTDFIPEEIYNSWMKNKACRS